MEWESLRPHKSYLHVTGRGELAPQAWTSHTRDIFLKNT